MNKQNIFLGVFTFVLGISTSLSAQTLERIFVEGGGIEFNNKQETVGSFEIAKYEITNAQYAVFLNTNKIPSNGFSNGKPLVDISSPDLQVEFKQGVWKPKLGKEDYPMVMVSYFGAIDYCKWVGGKLPTELEWFYAASGGKKSKNYIYAGSNTLEEVGWFNENNEGHSHKVGLKKPNELGIYDMSGNAWEWCLNENLKSAEDFCVHMGGSWYAKREPSSLKAHYGNTPTHFSNSVGFRVVFPVKD